MGIELVTSGLRKQMAIGQLKDFNFSKNRFRVSSGQVKDILNALFSQPQLEMMTVCLDSELLPEKQFSLVLNCWEQHADGKKLKWLEVHHHGSDDQDLWEDSRKRFTKIAKDVRM